MPNASRLYSGYTAEDCRLLCDYDPMCSCVTHAVLIGRCFRHTVCRLYEGAFVPTPLYDTFLKVPHLLPDYQSYRGQDTMNGFGSEQLDADFVAPGGLTEQECMDRCSMDSRCDCVVYSTWHTLNLCRTRRLCQPSLFQSDSMYTVFVKSPSHYTKEATRLDRSFRECLSHCSWEGATEDIAMPCIHGCRADLRYGIEHPVTAETPWAQERPTTSVQAAVVTSTLMTAAITSTSTSTFNAPTATSIPLSANLRTSHAPPTTITRSTSGSLRAQRLASKNSTNVVIVEDGIATGISKWEPDDGWMRGAARSPNVRGARNETGPPSWVVDLATGPHLTAVHDLGKADQVEDAPARLLPSPHDHVRDSLAIIMFLVACSCSAALLYSCKEEPNETPSGHAYEQLTTMNSARGGSPRRLEQIKPNRVEVLLAVERDGMALKVAADSMRADREVVLLAVRQNGMALQFASVRLRSDKSAVLEAVTQSGMALQFADRSNDDKEVVIAAVSQDGSALCLASERLKGDVEVVLAAVSKTGGSLCFASAELRSHPAVVMAAVSQHGLALKHASEAMRYNRDVVLAAVRQNGLVLQFAAEQLKYDLAVVREAVRQNGAAICFAGTPLREDAEVAMLAVAQSGWALKHLDDGQRGDSTIVMQAVRENGSALGFAAEHLRADRTVVLEAVRQNGWALSLAVESLKADREVVLCAVQQNGLALCLASEDLRADKEVVIAAVAQTASALKHAAEELRQDPEVITASMPGSDEHRIRRVLAPRGSSRQIALQ